MPTDRPDTAALIGAVRRHLQTQLLPTLQGAAAYDLRVAVKALDIVSRSLQRHAAASHAERSRLQALLGSGDDDNAQLNAQLCERLRSGAMAPDAPVLLAHLRATVLDKLAIDNPEFPLYREVLQRDTANHEQNET